MNTPLEYYEHLKGLIDQRLDRIIDRDEPVTMYQPARYVLGGGGKRIRPVLMLLACEAVGGDPLNAIDAGVAVEILHNFTLVHDDIMDHADTRRGRLTVHKKWDNNIAILVGDELMGIAYKTLLNTRSGDIREITSVFTDGVIEVCEGQSYDKEFEALPSVTEAQYLMMIGKKTGWLVAISAHMGAIIGDASPSETNALISYARHVGRAFQIQDDLLDAIAEEAAFGKPVGGDIIEGKKTYLLVTAMGLAEAADLKLLRQVAMREAAREGLVASVRDIYERLGVLDIARRRIEEDTNVAIAALDALPATNGRDMLVWLAHMLLDRKF